MNRSLLTLTCLLLTLNGCAMAYEPVASPRVTLTTAGVYKNGERVGGISYGTPLAVKGNARAEKEAEAGRDLTTAGWVLQFGALGTIAAGAAVAAGDENDEKAGLAIGLMAGALAASIVGDILWITANTHSVNAINIYNDGLGSSP